MRDNLLAVLPNGTTTQSYTPTWAGGTVAIGNGTLTGTYSQIGKQCVLNIRLVGGSTTNWGGATAWTFALPLTAAADSVSYTGIALILDSGTGFHSAVAYVTSGGTTISLYPTTANTPGAFTSTAPITWATSDEINLSLVYTVA